MCDFGCITLTTIILLIDNTSSRGVGEQVTVMHKYENVATRSTYDILHISTFTRGQGCPESSTM
jgi:hypothetical protein